MDGELLELEHRVGVRLGEDKGMKELGWGGGVSVVENGVGQEGERRDKSIKKRRLLGRSTPFDWIGNSCLIRPSLAYFAFSTIALKA